MKQIERYIFRRMATLTFWSLIAATTLVLTTQVLLRVDVLTTTGQAMSAFLKLAGTLVPSVMVIVVPFALLIGVGAVLSSMNSDSELVVMEAAGTSPRTVLKPVLILSMLLSMFVLLVSNIVEPWANTKLYSVMASAQSDLFSIAVRSGTFQRVEDGLYVQINEKKPGGELAGIFLSDTRTEGKELVYFAQRGSVQKIGDVTLLYMTDGELQQRDTGSDQISIISFTSYALDMAAFLPTGGAGAQRPNERSTSYLLDPPADDFYFKKAPQALKIEVVRRFSTWLYPLVFGLVAFTFLGKAHSNRQEQFQNVLLVTGITLGIRALGFYTGDAAGRTETAEIASYAVPLAAIVIFGLLAATGRTLTIPKRWAQMNAFLLDWIQTRLGMQTPTTPGGRP